jgi:hypothetical protein
MEYPWNAYFRYLCHREKVKRGNHLNVIIGKSQRVKLIFIVVVGERGSMGRLCCNHKIREEGNHTREEGS